MKAISIFRPTVRDILFEGVRSFLLPSSSSSSSSLGPLDRLLPFEFCPMSASPGLIGGAARDGSSEEEDNLGGMRDYIPS